MVVAATGIFQRRRRLKIGFNVLAQVLLCLWLLLIVNGWVFRHSWRSDWTRDQRYAISPETAKLLVTLPQTVEVVTDDRARRRARGSRPSAG